MLPPAPLTRRGLFLSPNQHPTMKLFPFQRRDFAAFTIPYIWRSRRVLIVAPGDLHQQLQQHAAKHFGVALPVVTTVDDLNTYRLGTAVPPLRPR